MSSESNQPRIISGPIGATPRMKLIGVLAVLFALITGISVARRHTLAENGETRARADQLEDQLSTALEQLERTRQQLAVAERGGQVTDTANTELRVEIGERQNEIAGLKADNEFYRRLLGTGGSSNGLAVHALQLESTSSSQVFRYQLTLSQNLKKARVVSGAIELIVEGVQSDRARNLATGELDLQGDASRSRFEFKYFQQLGGSFSLPMDFVPEHITVRLMPEGRGRKPVAREFAWNDVRDGAVAESDESLSAND